MPQMTLFAPDITCDHCIATIKKTVNGVAGAQFVDGNPQAQAFVIDVISGAVLDSVAEALAGEGYPIGPASIGHAAAAASEHGAHQHVEHEHGGMQHGVAMHMASPSAGFTPRYRIEKTAAGADVHYNCSCGSEDEVFHFDRSQAEQRPHSCCNHHLLVEPNAGERLRAMVGEGYTITVTDVEMPWGQPMQAAFAVAK